MIRLAKGPVPAVLLANAHAWNDAIQRRAADGEEPTPAEKTKYRHPDIKAALVNETSNKCAYCESKLQHIHHGDVEHIVPKSLDISKIFDWDNLTLACEICNQNKSNLDPNANEIIDPYRVDPAIHVHFQGAFVFPLGTAKGTSTIAILDLNRPRLIEERAERLKYLMGILDNVLRSDLPLAVRRSILKNFFERDASSKESFCKMASDALSALVNRLPADVRAGIV